MSSVFLFISLAAVTWGFCKGPLGNPYGCADLDLGSKNFGRIKPLFFVTAAVAAFGSIGAAISFLFMIGVLPHAR